MVYQGTEGGYQGKEGVCFVVYVSFKMYTSTCDVIVAGVGTS